MRLSVTVRVSLDGGLLRSVSALKGVLLESKGSGDLTGGRAVAALRRLDLALVVAAQVGVPVRALGRAVERHERELGDREPGIELDRDAREVRDLERQRAAEARVDEAGGRVDDEAEAPDRALALDARDDVVGQLDPLQRPPEDELAGVDDERRRPPRPRRRSVRFVGGSRRSIAAARWLWKTRKPSPSRTSTDAGWTMPGSHGSILMRPALDEARMVPSERTEVGGMGRKLPR